MLGNEKECFKCGELKERSDFYVHREMADGLLGKCKECCKKDVKENYKLNREKFSLYEKKRNQKPERKAKKLIYQANRRARNPEKERTRYLTTNAIRDGRLIKKPCIYCNSEKVQAHHHDYSKPLDVIWVCFTCHREREHGQTVANRDYGI
jgi:hypothetical protein